MTQHNMNEPRIRLRTPTGGAMTAPQRPADWHGHPFVWSWCVGLGSLSVDFIKARCKEAADQDAPADAVYRTGPKDPAGPNTWITLDQLHEDNRERVAAYGRALLKWEEDLAAHHRRQTPQAQPQPASALPAGARVLTLAKRTTEQH
ncbi:hypothetical protein [Streptomyces sp. NPDC001089]